MPQKSLAVANSVLASLAIANSVAARDVARGIGHVTSASLVFGRVGTLHSRYLLDAILDAARSRAFYGQVSLGPEAVAGFSILDVRVESGFAVAIIPPRRPPSRVQIASVSGAVG